RRKESLHVDHPMVLPTITLDKPRRRLSCLGVVVVCREKLSELPPRMLSVAGKKKALPETPGLRSKGLH
ncbi:MAG: hypothetical protein PVI61_09765, partial [Methyloceanibacter sp.]